MGGGSGGLVGWSPGLGGGSQVVTSTPGQACSGLLGLRGLRGKGKPAPGWLLAEAGSRARVLRGAGERVKRCELY